MWRWRLHYVTGKGGVGKSTVAAALALAAAGQGARVLAIELGEAAGLCRALGVRPAGPGAIAAAGGGVAAAYFDGAAALAEYLTRKVRLGGLLAPVLAHPLYAAFVAAAPGVRELLAVGKVRDELVLQRDRGRARWDVVVVDAGASGHALEHLRMPAAAAAAFAAGRVHREAERNAALLRDPRTTRVHVVATPESMPLAEAAQVIATVSGLGLPLGRLFANRCRPVAPAGVDAALARLGALDPGGDADAAAARPAVVAALTRARAWERLQEAELAGAEAALGVRAARLPRLVPAAEATGHARALAPLVAEAL